MLNVTLDDVKNALGVTGDFQDFTLNEYFNEVVSFLKDAGVKEEHITSGIVSRGVADLWDYGSGAGTLSDYFYKRATQLSYKK